MQYPSISQENNNETTMVPNTVSELKLFDVEDFIYELKVNSANKNKQQQFYSNSINSYDIAHNCIREVFFKILNYPVENYENSWLPILLRATLGNAVHDFIQSNYSNFTEIETSIKVPSIRASVRTDALINHNVLCEIKSCTYSDYSTILSTRKPRTPDFYQTMYNRYLLHNHLAEAKQQKSTRSSPPKLDYYKIDYIQLIYVAHDIISCECKSISECLEVAKKVKQMLKSKYNQFHFINVVTINLNNLAPDLVQSYENWIVEKINNINNYINNNVVPPLDNPFINTKGCHFCMYKKVCSQYGGG